MSRGSLFSICTRLQIKYQVLLMTSQKEAFVNLYTAPSTRKYVLHSRDSVREERR